MTKALASGDGTTERAGKAYLRLRGHEDGCLAIAGFEGTGEDVARRRGRAAELMRAAGGISLGQRPGRMWLASRFSAPYLRDELLDRGVMVETLETATTWSRLGGLYAAVGDALRDRSTGGSGRCLVMCHVSHTYPSGASLYFTFFAPHDDELGLEAWWAAKSAACDAIMANGGTLTHHHGVGRDHASWLGEEIGELGLDLLKSAKAELDPDGIMNPGKLLEMPPAG